MSSFYAESLHSLDDGTRRINNAVFISKDRQSQESEDDEDSDSCSVVSTLTTGTLKAPEELDYYSDSSTSTTVAKILSKKRCSDPEAYKKWLNAKNELERKQKEKERVRRKREELKKQQEDEKRKQKSEEKLKQWMERKEMEKQRKSRQQEHPKEGRKAKVTEKVSKQWIPNDESITNFNVWLNRVKQQEEQAKLRVVAKHRVEEEFKHQRQDLSKMFYDEWLKSSKSKPKPVPLNRGTESLRGTISKIFINPKPWQSNID